MEIKNYIIGAIACLALVASVGALTKTSTVTYVNPTTGEKQVAGLAGPVIPSDFLNWGNVSTYKFAQTMTQGASTTCNWQTPAATSTVSIKARFTLASTSATLVEFGKSPSTQATTTLISRITLAAGVPGTIYSTTTSTGGYDDVLVAAPSTWLAVKIGGGAAGSVPTGSCNFEAELLP